MMSRQAVVEQSISCIRVASPLGKLSTCAASLMSTRDNLS